jgi:ABC-type nitrate/sulfonate/bicarbonate transport system substrate-binding protein
MGVTRGEFLRYLAGTGAALLGPGWLAPRPGRAQAPSFVYGPHPAPEAFVWGSRDWGAKYQVAVRSQWFNNGAESNDALVAGKIEGNAPGAGGIVALNAAQPGKFAQAMVWSYGDYSATLVRPDSPYKTLADLKGKKVGVLVGSGSYITWLVYIEENGLKVEDFQVVNMRGEDIPAALSGKVIDAATIWEPYVALMEHKEIGRIVASFAKSVYDQVHLQVRAETLQKNRAGLVRMVAAALDVQDFIRQNPTEAAQLISKAMAQRGIDVPWQAFEVVVKQRVIFKPDFSDDVKKSLDKIGQVALKLGRIKQLPAFTFATDVVDEAKRLRA